MDPRSRVILELIAYGDDPAVRPADRIKAVELLRELEPRVDEATRRVVEEVHAMSEAELAADVDELRAAVIAEVDRDRDHLRATWPATLTALDRIRADARRHAEAADRVSCETDSVRHA